LLEWNPAAMAAWRSAVRVLQSMTREECLAEIAEARTPSSNFLVGVEAPKPAGGIMRRLFRVAFFACGSIVLLLNLISILVAFDREAEVGSALVTAIEAIWIDGVTFYQ
jgi:hypothetical protein